MLVECIGVERKGMEGLYSFREDTIGVNER